MKRSEALQPLSRDHHQALFVALQLRRAEEPAAAIATFLDFWEGEGRHHFQIEEDVLLPLWSALGRNVDEEAVARLAQEHLRIRTAALELGDGAVAVERLHELGELLDGHVRFEERELFPRIEADLGEEQLGRVQAAVEAAERE